MGKLSLILFMTLVVGLPKVVNAYDQLVIVQAVSTTKKTFVIRKGFTDGIAIGQESLFTIRGSGVVATATEVNRSLSIWEVTDKRSTVAFDKNEYVTFTNSIENMILELPNLENHNIEDVLLRNTASTVLKANFSYALSDSVSSTDAEAVATRSGYQLEGVYLINFSPRWDFGFGLRYDSENQRVTGPFLTLDVPTTRIMATTEFQYRFNQVPGSRDYFYAGAGIGYGQSNTIISDVKSSGPVFVLPVVKFGYSSYLGRKTSMILEAAMESVAADETLTTGDEQSTTVLNSKISIGLKF